MLLKFKCHLNLNVIETKMSPKNLKVTNKMSLKKMSLQQKHEISLKLKCH